MTELIDALTQVALGMLPVRGFTGALALLGFALLAVLFAVSLERLRDHLEDQGLLPRLLALTQATLRSMAVLFTLLAALAVVPEGLLLLLPILLVAATLGLGHALALWLPDVLAGLTLVVEGRLHPGHTVEVDGQRGVLTWIGVRTTRMVDRRGRLVHLPNRSLLGAVVHDPSRWPEVVVKVQVPAGVPATVAQQRLEEIGALSPWRAPTAIPRVLRDPETPLVYELCTRIIDIRFADPHTRSVLGMAQEAFEESTDP
jgi:hypothetical protein